MVSLIPHIAIPARTVSNKIISTLDLHLELAFSVPLNISKRHIAPNSKTIILLGLTQWNGNGRYSDYYFPLRNGKVHSIRF